MKPLVYLALERDYKPYSYQNSLPDYAAKLRVLCPVVNLGLHLFSWRVRLSTRMDDNLGKDMRGLFINLGPVYISLYLAFKAFPIWGFDGWVKDKVIAQVKTKDGQPVEFHSTDNPFGQ